MPIEIERKFLVKNDSYKTESSTILKIKQGFLNSNKNRVVRIRLVDKIAFITVKGISSEDGTSRYEWEKEIPKKEAEQLLELCEKTIIEKNRYIIKHAKHTFEVDEFLGANSGLCIAEIELESANESFEKPTWLGKEVTGNSAYYNSELSKSPYCYWT